MFVSLMGVAIFVAGLAGVVWSVRAGTAHIVYRVAKRQTTEGGLDGMLRLCGRAQSLYPWNYYVCIRAAEASYYGSGEPRSAQWKERIQVSRAWCERGLRQNPWKSQLRRLKARLLWLESPRAAVDYWSAYVDWHYWEPHNHAVLAEMYGQLGDFKSAEKEMALIAAFPESAEARKNVLRSKTEWDAMLNGSLSGWGE